MSEVEFESLELIFSEVTISSNLIYSDLTWGIVLEDQRRGILQYGYLQCHPE